MNEHKLHEMDLKALRREILNILIAIKRKEDLRIIYCFVRSFRHDL